MTNPAFQKTFHCTMKFKQRRKKFSHKGLLLKNKFACISRNTWTEERYSQKKNHFCWPNSKGWCGS